MVTLSEFRENARSHGLCEKYSHRWDSCVSKKALIDMALDPNGVEYLCKSFRDGWGITDDSILSSFGNFVNGKYTADFGKYTSKLYCNYSGDITADTTLLTMINCNARVHVPDFHICNIYLSGKNSIEFSGKGKVYISSYCSDGGLSISGGCGFIKRTDF